MRISINFGKNAKVCKLLQAHHMHIRQIVWYSNGIRKPDHLTTKQISTIQIPDSSIIQFPTLLQTLSSKTFIADASNALEFVKQLLKLLYNSFTVQMPYKYFTMGAVLV